MSYRGYVTWQDDPGPGTIAWSERDDDAQWAPEPEPYRARKPD